MGRYGNFTPDGIGLAQLMLSPDMRAHIHERAKRIEGAARAISPVGEENGVDHAHYVEAWRVEDDVKQGEARPFDPNRRARSTVINDSDHAAAIEFGNFRTRKRTIDPHYVLTRAIDAARD